MLDYAKIRGVACYHARRWPTSTIDADDLTQEAICAALSGRKSVDGPMLDVLRASPIVGNTKNGASKALPITRTLGIGSCEDEVIAAIDLSRLSRRITPKNWDAIRLYWIEGLTGPEAASALRIRMDAFNFRHYVGLKALRQIVGRTK